MLFIRCDECRQEKGVDAFGGAPKGWVVEGLEHFCSSVCATAHDRRKQPRRGPVTTARPESDRCACGCAYGDHAAKPPNRCLDCKRCGGFNFARLAGTAKLSEHDAEEIRGALLTGTSVRELADRFGVVKTTIENVRDASKRA
jgi:hypothetical protein